MNSPIAVGVQAIRQINGYARWCLPKGHLWSGPDPERSPELGPPDWKGLCVTCGLVAKPRPGWRRLILMGDCIPSGEQAHDL
jgi:hypothetical protein